MNIYQQLWQSLTPLYEPREAQALLRTVLEVKYGMTLTDIICGKVNELFAEESKDLEKIIEKLKNSEPVQYILGEALFAGRTFHVEPGVLIPRPETAELCDWVTLDEKARNRHPLKLLDLCTGSGCIAITLALNLPWAEVSAVDISNIALQVAKENAMRLKAQISYYLASVENLPREVGKWDTIVSNPPYICEKEKKNISKNVLDYEPELALFVPDEDPLRFYRAIAQYATTALKPGGSLYFEINPLYAKETRDLLAALNFCEIEVRKDLEGKERMVKGIRN